MVPHPAHSDVPTQEAAEKLTAPARFWQRRSTPEMAGRFAGAVGAGRLLLSSISAKFTKGRHKRRTLGEVCGAPSGWTQRTQRRTHARHSPQLFNLPAIQAARAAAHERGGAGHATLTKVTRARDFMVVRLPVRYEGEPQGTSGEDEADDEDMDDEDADGEQ